MKKHKEKEIASSYIPGVAPKVVKISLSSKLLETIKAVTVHLGKDDNLRKLQNSAITK